MDYQKIKSLVELMNSSDLEELIYREGEISLILNRSGNTSANVSRPLNNDFALASVNEEEISLTSHEATTDIAPSFVPSTSVDIQSPLYGVVYLSPSEGEAPYVSVGDSVVEGQTLCLLEAMKMFHPIKAEASGCVREIRVESGDEVESNQSLFLID